MTKNELIKLTLSSLIDNSKTSPESYDFISADINSFNKYGIETIVWRPKISVEGQDDTIVDPNNQHAVVINFNYNTNELSCHIFLKAPPNLTNMYQLKPDCSTTSKRWLEQLRLPYRKFSRLKKLIIARDSQKENSVYLKKLSSIMPGIFDKYFL